MRLLYIALAVIGVVAIGAVAWTEIGMAGIETPGYEVVRSEGDLEVRQYPPMILASVAVTGSGQEARSTGFRVLADYIFGNNTTRGKVAMTAPVEEEPGASIAMTAPVEVSGAVISFVMPSEYTMESLPKPNNTDVILRERPGERVAAVRFSGVASEEDMARHERRLRAWMASEGLTAAGPAREARYDPPWRLPFMRRNEVLIPLVP